MSARDASMTHRTGLAAALAAALLLAAPAQAEPREFFIVTVHVDGNTALTAAADHPAEAFPAQAMPAGGGLILTKPDEAGKWRMRAFVFHPTQVIVRQGDEVKLTFVAVQGAAHKIKVDGVAEEIAIKRGEAKSVTVRADKPGTIAYAGIDRQPSMRGEIVVLPK